MRYLILILMLFLTSHAYADSTKPAHETIGTIVSADDTGAIPAVVFDARTDVGALGTRPAFCWDIFNTSYACMDKDGNFGIGDSTPDAKLDVEGTAIITSTLTIGAYTLPATDGTNGQGLKTDGSGTVTWGSVAGGAGGVGTASDKEFLWDNATAVDGTDCITWDDTNDTFDICSTGEIDVVGNATAAQYIKLLEDTDDGAHWYKAQGSALSSNITRNVRDWDIVHYSIPYLNVTNGDTIPLGTIDRAWTVSDLGCYVVDGTSVVITVRECDANGDSCANIDNATITCAATRTNDDGSILSPSIESGNTMDVLIGTITGGTTEMNIMINGLVDSE